MGLKVKNIENLITPLGYSDSLIRCSIKKVIFNFDGLENSNVQVLFELTPSTWREGIPKNQYTATIPVDLNNQEIMGLILTNSDAIHDLVMPVEFIPTIDGFKSFTQLNAETQEA